MQLGGVLLRIQSTVELLAGNGTLDEPPWHDTLEDSVR